MRVPLSAALVIFVGSVASHGDEPKLPQRPPVKLPKLDGLPGDAEVHVVGVAEPLFSGISPDEIADWQGLVKALRGKDGPAAHIRKLLSKAADEVLTEQVELGQVDNLKSLRTKVTIRLSLCISKAMRAGVFYDETAFAKIELPQRVQEWVALGDKRTTFQTQLMNRELLLLACPNCIAPTPANFQTVRVTVKPGKPVVLVTTSSQQCHWVVTVEKGAKVVGVVQCGGGAQDVTGTEAPVTYVAGRWPNGKSGPTPGFNAYQEEDTQDFKRFKAAVKEITGRDYASFQGAHTAGKEPFVVTPSK